MKSAIIIPARYGSTRFPGKPLHCIAGKPMIQYVYETAQLASTQVGGCQVVVATDNDRIANETAQLGMETVMTSMDCASGTDRVLQAANLLDETPEVIVNLQGDSPLTPANYLVSLLTAFQINKRADVMTLAVRLNWAELDEWRSQKEQTPFSGTSVLLDKNNQALWFSKQVLPAIRDEQAQRKESQYSPVWRHVGVYGYRLNMLKTFVRLEKGHYESLEGLEQLRLLENGYQINVLEMDSEGGLDAIGVDTIEDANRVEAKILKKQETV